jgi:hypothetical protein
VRHQSLIRVNEGEELVRSVRAVVRPAADLAQHAALRESRKTVVRTLMTGADPEARVAGKGRVMEPA